MRKGEREAWEVLLAEDNDDHALLIQMALERASRLPVHVHRARNGDEAVSMVQDTHPDLVLLDLKMPGRSGHEVLEIIKGDDEYRRIPVAVLTSSDRDEDLARSYGLGGNHFITKPEDPAQLEAKLRSLLKNVEELSGIRRGAGRLEATAVSAMDPGSLAFRKIVLWGALVIALVALVIFAYLTGVLG
ncbi:MAG: response regulator [Gemmatimonadota bacterium]